MPIGYVKLLLGLLYPLLRYCCDIGTGVVDDDRNISGLGRHDDRGDVASALFCTLSDAVGAACTDVPIAGTNKPHHYYYADQPE